MKGPNVSSVLKSYVVTCSKLKQIDGFIQRKKDNTHAPGWFEDRKCLDCWNKTWNNKYENKPSAEPGWRRSPTLHWPPGRRRRTPEWTRLHLLDKYSCCSHFLPINLGCKQNTNQFYNLIFKQKRLVWRFWDSIFKTNQWSYFCNFQTHHHKSGVPIHSLPQNSLTLQTNFHKIPGALPSLISQKMAFHTEYYCNNVHFLQPPPGLTFCRQKPIFARTVVKTGFYRFLLVFSKIILNSYKMTILFDSC